MRAPLAKVVPALAVVVLTVLTTTACGGPGGGAATTNDGACATVLPLARTIVANRGTPVLIRRIDRGDADALSREVGAVPPPPPPPPSPTRQPPPTRQPAPTPRPAGTNRVPKTCLVVYHGDYPPGAIGGATPPATSGSYALMVLQVRRPAVERILVTPTLPPDTVHRSWWRRVLSVG